MRGGIVGKLPLLIAAGAGALVLALAQGCGVGDQPRKEVFGVQGPNNFRGRDFVGEKNFAYLFKKYQKGIAKNVPWSGYWWGYKDFGIASPLWSGENGTKGQFGPAGKYDAARGGKTQAQDWEAKFHSMAAPVAEGQHVEGWWGHCNGWSAAAALFPEPRHDIKVNGINFTVADIKALLTESMMQIAADYYGTRVDEYRDYNTPKYWDVVPDQFFLVMANYLGQGQPVLLDRWTGSQVWNQPMVAYKFEDVKPSDYLGAHPKVPGVYRVNATVTIYWADDMVPGNRVSEPFNWEDAYDYGSRTLKMELWVDQPLVFDANGSLVSSGNIVVTRGGPDYFVGGVWKNGSDGYVEQTHPDYLWVPFGPLPMADRDPTYSNPWVDIDWVRKFLVTDRTEVTTGETPVAPKPAPSALPSPNPDPSPSPDPANNTNGAGTGVAL